MEKDGPYKHLIGEMFLYVIGKDGPYKHDDGKNLLAQ